MNNERIEEIREFLHQPDDVYEEAPAIALELLVIVDELVAIADENYKRCQKYLPSDVRDALVED